jgi:hypothetical protein
MSTDKKKGDHHKTSGNHDIGGDKKQDNSGTTEDGNRNQSQGHGGHKIGSTSGAGLLRTGVARPLPARQSLTRWCQASRPGPIRAAGAGDPLIADHG